MLYRLAVSLRGMYRNFRLYGLSARRWRILVSLALRGALGPGVGRGFSFFCYRAANRAVAFFLAARGVGRRGLFLFLYSDAFNYP